MENNITNIGFNRFPDEMVSNEEKKKPEFGRQFASAIWSEWNSRYYTRAKFIENLRKYAAGEHDVSDCKKNISGEYTDIEYWEVDWDDKLNLLPILLRNFRNTVNMDELQPVVKAIDPSAIEFKNKRKNDKLKLFYAKEFIQEAAQLNGGQSPIPLDQIPLSKEQVELEEQTAEPLKIEKAESLVLEAVARDNYFQLIQEDVLEEMLITNYGIGKVTTCPVKGVKMEMVKLENFVYGRSSNRYFSDCNYYGEIKTITVGQLKNIAKESNIKLSDEQIRKMARLPEVSTLELSTEIKVLFYAFKTFFDDSAVVKKVYSKKVNKNTNAIKLIPKSEYKPRSENEKTQDVIDNYDVWFEGVMVLDADNTIIRHRLMQNMAENKSNGNIIPPYIVMRPRNKSIVEEVIPRIKALQELHFRILHYRNTLKGAITDLDPDMIANVTIGNDKLTPREVLSMYFTKGIRFIKSRDDDGEYIARSANISESDTPIPRALIELTNQFVREIQLLNQTFGAVQYDPMSPDPKTLGEMELYRFSANSSMRDYTNALYQWTVMCYQSVSSRINDAIKWKNVRDRFVSAIGTDDVETIEEFKKNREHHFFGIYTDLVPTAEERANLQRRLEYYAQNGILTPLDEMRITNVRNRTQALALLNLIIMSKQKEIQQQKEQDAQRQTNGNIESAVAAQRAKQETMQLEYQLRMQEKQVEFEHKAFLLQKEGEIKLTEANIIAGAKIQTAQWTAQYSADLAKTKKELDYKARIDGIDRSAYNQQQLIKLRKGEIDNIDANPDTENVDLSQLDNDYQAQNPYTPIVNPNQ